MAYISNGQPPRARTDTRKRTPAYELRVARSLEPDQPKLFDALGLLARNTSNFIDYKDPAEDELSVTLLMLGPLLRHLLGVGPGKRVPTQKLREVEQDLNQRLAPAKFRDYEIPLADPLMRPLSLYGARDQYVGIPLSSEDLRLTGDRAMVEGYFVDRFGLSKRQLRRRLVDLHAHATVGRVLYDQLSAAETAALQADPSTFILGTALARQQRQLELTGEGTVVPTVFPEAVSLNGLRIVCQPKGT